MTENVQRMHIAYRMVCAPSVGFKIEDFVYISEIGNPSNTARLDSVSVRDRFLYRVYIIWYRLDSVYRDLMLVPESLNISLCPF